MKKEIGRGKQIEYLRTYLNKEFGEEYGKPFSYVQTKKVYDALGGHYDPKARIEIDSIVGEVMGSRTIDENNFRPVDFSELELLTKNSGNSKTKFNEFGEIVSIFLFLIGGSFFLSSNLTGNVVGLSNSTSSWIGGVLILIGLIVLWLFIRSKKKKDMVVKKVSKPIGKPVRRSALMSKKKK